LPRVIRSIRKVGVQIMEKISAFFVGIKAGFNQHQCLSVTRHYDDLNILEIHDRGATLGQKLRNPFNNQAKRDGLKVFF
jgi:hypothetical protein